METNELIKNRACFIARKLGITLDEAKKMKADELKPPKKVRPLNDTREVFTKILENEAKIKESEDVKTDL